MTDNFGSKALIGEGSYGRVYYASLSNGKAVAVKKLDVSSEPDSNGDFLTQVCVQCRYINRSSTLQLYLSCPNTLFSMSFDSPSPASGFYSL